MLLIPEGDFNRKFKCAVCRRLMTYCESRRLPAARFEPTARTGCPICQAVRCAVETLVADPTLRASCLVGLEAQMTLYVGPDMQRIPVDVYCLRSADRPWKDVVRMRHLYRSTGALRCWQRAEKWLRLCEKEHEPCRPRAEAPPTRLLDLEVVTGGDVRLVDGATAATDDTQSVRYACLSHCWGLAGCPIKTTTGNVERYYEGIQWFTLPTTYRQAVMFLRFLGVRYLWVDSLCIVQDDPEDWFRESAKMAAVFSGSYITVAATSAANNQASMFVDRPGPPGRLSCPYGDKQSLDFYVRRAIDHDQFWRADDSIIEDPKDDPRLPLLARGWVHQERVLAPRVLHFTGDEMVWECHGGSRCECGAHKRCRGFVKATASTALVRRDPDPHDVDRLWRVAVDNYTCKRLTFDKDRLPALAGLARRFADMKGLHREYLAGLWGDHLARDLLWFVPGPAASRAIDGGAPSSSWAALDAWTPFFVSHGDDDPAVEILRADVELRGPDRFGQVKSGVIVLRGILEPLGVRGPHNPGNAVAFYVAPFQKAPDDYTGFEVAFGDGVGELGVKVNIWFDTGLPDGKEQFALKVTANACEMRFLVLTRADEKGQDHFVRVGVGTWKGRQSRENPKIPVPFKDSTSRLITLL